MDKINKIAATVFVVACAPFLLAAAAMADPTYTLPADPTSGAFEAIAGSVKTWVTSVGLPTLVPVVALGIMISLVLAWSRKAGAAAKKVGS